MIFVTRLDDSELVVNSELIVSIEGTPDTMITMTTGERFLVKEPVAEVVERAIAYRRRIHRGVGDPPPEPARMPAGTEE